MYPTIPSLFLLARSAGIACAGPIILSPVDRQGYGINAGVDPGFQVSVGHLDPSKGDVAWQANTQGALGGDNDSVFDLLYDSPLSGDAFNVLLMHTALFEGQRLDISRTGIGGMPCAVFLQQLVGPITVSGKAMAIDGGSANCLHLWKA